MTAYSKLRLANLLMLAGLVPLLISMLWMASNFSAGSNSKLYIAEALMKMGFAYMFAIVVSCGSALWSVLVEKRNAGARVTGTAGIRIFVVLFLFAPIVLHVF